MPNMIDPTDEGNNVGDNDTLDPNIGASLGLGTFAEAKNGTQSTVGSEEKNNQAVYDSYGNFTYPFSTKDRYINRRYIQFHCNFYTQRDEYDAYWVVGRNDKIHDTKRAAGEFDQELMGFHTDNQNKGIPTMEIYLFAYRNWEQILRPNDYVALRVFESYPDDPYYLVHSGDTKVNLEDRNGIRHRTLMVGLVSNIQVSEDATSGAKVYVVTCSGMQKILANVQLGLPKEAQWNDVNSIYDINGASNPANESFPTYSKGGSSSAGAVKGSSKEVGSQIEQGLIEWCNKQGYSVSQTAGLLASARGESNMGQANNGFNLLGYSPGSNTVGTGNNLPHTKQGAYDYCGMFLRAPGTKLRGYKSVSEGKSPYQCGTIFCAYVDIPNDNNSTSSSTAQERGRWAQQYASEIK